MTLPTQAVDVLGFYDRFLNGWGKSRSECIASLASEWEALVHTIEYLSQSGSLDSTTSTIASTVARNISICVQNTLSIEASAESELEELVRDLGRVCEFPALDPTDGASFRARKRRGQIDADSPYLTPPSESPLSAAPSTTATSTPPLLELQPADHLRLWFLDHLANPYPTTTEKRELSRVTGIAKNKIDSDMTNWRRRAGWTDIKDTYADRDKVKMQRLIEAVQARKEKRTAVIEAVEKMRAYLERREEYGVGSWVYSLKKMAKEEQARKKPRIEAKTKTKADRPITPPPSAHVTPASSVGPSSNTLFGVHNTSPTISLRSTSSSSSLGSTSSLPTFTNFKPYSFTPAPLTFSSAPLPAPTPAIVGPVESVPPTVLAPGIKRPSIEPQPNGPSTRQKLAPSLFSTDAVPQWAPDVDHSQSQPQPQPQPVPPTHITSASLYPSPPTANFAEPIVWSAGATMPTHLPHMSTMPRTMPTFTMPQQHDFQFTLPMNAPPPSS